MKYTIKAHRTRYANVWFRSRLEARWAAFFDLIGWKWEYEPIDLPGWSPDFRVVFPCGHSECEKTDGNRDGRHSLLVEIKPYFELSQFKGHPCLDYPYGIRKGGHFDSVDILVCEGKTAYRIQADASAAFGNSPELTHWEMTHGAGGGEERIENWTTKDLKESWAEAGNKTQWRPRV